MSSAPSYLPVDYSQSVLDYYLTYWPGVGVAIQMFPSCCSMTTAPSNLAAGRSATAQAMEARGAMAAIKLPLSVPDLARKVEKSLMLVVPPWSVCGVDWADGNRERS